MRTLSIVALLLCLACPSPADASVFSETSLAGAKKALSATNSTSGQQETAPAQLPPAATDGSAEAEHAAQLLQKGGAAAKSVRFDELTKTLSIEELSAEKDGVVFRIASIAWKDYSKDLIGQKNIAVPPLEAKDVEISTKTNDGLFTMKIGLAGISNLLIDTSSAQPIRPLDGSSPLMGCTLRNVRLDYAAAKAEDNAKLEISEAVFEKDSEDGKFRFKNLVFGAADSFALQIGEGEGSGRTPEEYLALVQRYSTTGNPDELYAFFAGTLEQGGSLLEGFASSLSLRDIRCDVKDEAGQNSISIAEISTGLKKAGDKKVPYLNVQGLFLPQGVFAALGIGDLFPQGDYIDFALSGELAAGTFAPKAVLASRYTGELSVSADTTFDTAKTAAALRARSGNAAQNGEDAEKTADAAMQAALDSLALHRAEAAYTDRGGIALAMRYAQRETGKDADTLVTQAKLLAALAKTENDPVLKKLVDACADPLIAMLVKPGTLRFKADFPTPLTVNTTTVPQNYEPACEVEQGQKSLLDMLSGQ